MTSEKFRNIQSTIPAQPGIYKYFDSNNELIYVGKAKNIRKRVSSYFNKTLVNYKTHELVHRISKIEFTIVNNEQDAFLLENSLIKQFQPRYNINLKDDKSYPFLVIKNEPFPRIFLTRRIIDDGSEYLGPFTSVKKVKELLGFIQQTIPLRNCSLNLTEKNIKKGKFKVCLEYHLGNCKGPCESLQSAEDYQENLKQVKNLLKGNLAPVIRHFRIEMKNHAENLEFEKAAQIKKKIEFLNNYQSKSVIVSKKVGDADVFSIVREKDIAFVNYLMVRNGIIIQTHNSKVETHLNESPEEILSFSIAHLRETFNSDAKEIISPVMIQISDENIINSIPKGGEKKKLLELSEKNAKYYIEELRNKERLKTGMANKEHEKILRMLQSDLQLPDIPVNIECFDNSNFQGSFPVAAMVSFKNGLPDKKNYRHFNIKSVKGIDDFASMKEVVSRRYKRILSEEESFPQLIIIDGGKGQLNAAVEALNGLKAGSRTTIIGLAKNEEEIFFPGDMQPVKLPYASESLKLIRRIRDEVHRFGITFHRNKRSKGTFKNELEEIPGIGKNTVDILLKEFKSVKNIRERKKDELAKLIGVSKAGIIKKYFEEKDAD